MSVKRVPRALLSVSDKSGLVEFARGLVARGFELVSTGGTERALERAGLAAIGIASVTGFPEMMDGRVKTLHPLVHGGILARRGRPNDLASAAEHGIALIDLVVVNLYPFVQAAANPATPFDALVEEIDVGGPSLVRAAAKNFRDVLVVVSPGDYPAVLEEWDRPGGPTPSFRFALAQKAFSHTSDYDAAITQTLARCEVDAEGRFARSAAGAEVAPREIRLTLRKSRDLRYGENPHQKAALYEATLDVLQGKELSYTNLLDLDAAARIVREFTEPAAVVVKHTNPCGAATGASAVEAYVRAREADPISAFGGIVGLNRPIDPHVAAELTASFIEAVIAPSVDEEARPILAKKANMRVVRPTDVVALLHADQSPIRTAEIRSIAGGILVQAPDAVDEAREPWPQGSFPQVVTRRAPTPQEWQALRFSWQICAHVKSNAVVFTSADRTLAIGAGQMSRVDAVRVARMKAEAVGAGVLKGSVAASDAFFPFRDGLDAVAEAGATAVVQPGGSVRDSEVIAAADERSVAMVFTGRRHFRH
jgi:phosphoribosylaminoimidazolecarboxamide formyltransferase/IMP cyclohydrolase